MIDEGLADCVKNIRPVEFEIPTGERVKIFIENISIASPKVPASCITARTKRIFPSECRMVSSVFDFWPTKFTKNRRY